MTPIPPLLLAFAWLYLGAMTVLGVLCLVTGLAIALGAFREWMGRVPDGWAEGRERGESGAGTASVVDLGSLMKVLADDGRALLDEERGGFVPWEDVKRDHGLVGPPETWPPPSSDWQTDPGPGATQW